MLTHSQQHLVEPQLVNQLGIAVPASPAVAIWDEHGKLAYFGPYSSGLVCGQGDDFVSRVMVRLTQKQNPEWINMLGVGCFCPWQSQIQETKAQQTKVEDTRVQQKSQARIEDKQHV